MKTEETVDNNVDKSNKEKAPILLKTEQIKFPLNKKEEFTKLLSSVSMKKYVKL